MTVNTVNNVIYVDGNIYTTLQSAANGLGARGVVDDRGCNGTTIPATITGQTYPVTYLLGPCTYNGPASGSTFLFNSFQQNGSSITGSSGVTANQQSNYGNGTVIKANASNTSRLIQIASGSAVQTLQGYRLENLALDGNQTSTTSAPNTNDLLYLDAVRNSRFQNLSFNNCTGYMIRTTATNSNANQGTQFNKFDGISGGSCNSFLLLDGNSTATSTTTLNNFSSITVNYSCTACDGIEIRQGDGNEFIGIHNIVPTAGSS